MTRGCLPDPSYHAVSPIKSRASRREPPKTADTLTGELRREASGTGNSAQANRENSIMNTHIDEFASHSGESTSVFGQFLDAETLRSRAPAVFAESAHERTSPSYAFLSTQKLLQALDGAGFRPVEATQSSTRLRSPLHARHLVRLRRRYETVELRDSILELILTNSHDGTAAYHLRMGIFRVVCRNGMAISDGTFPVWRVAHRGDILDELIAAAVKMTERFESLAAQIERMERTILEPPQQLAFAGRAAQIRYPNGIPSGLDAAKLLTARRPEDVGNDAWRVFNKVQEHVLRGGIGLADGRGRRRSTRGISSISSNLRVNTALWEEAVALAA